MATSGLKIERSLGIYDELVKAYPDCPDVWKYFLQMTEIPRPSKHMAQIVEWAKEKGRELGAEVKVDQLGNVCLRFAASPGKESCPGVVLQAHLDMVPTKTPEHEHAFTRDPIVPYIDGTLLRARNTTLGGDDGSGVATALAVAADKTLVRGPLELLFTVDEEVGLTGALGLTEGELLSPQAKYLINIDSEDWGEVCLSCAGGVDRQITVPVTRAAHDPEWVTHKLVLKDFRGGHTGVEIHTCRASAVKWAALMFLRNPIAIAGTPYRLHWFMGGNAHNAVPSLVELEFSVPAGKSDDFVRQAQAVFDALLLLYPGEVTPKKRPSATFTRLAAPTTPEALSIASSRTALHFIDACPHGVWRWSESVPNLVETSQSLSVFELGPEAKAFEAEVFARSSNNDALRVLSKQLEELAALYSGTSVPKSEDCPGWPAEPNSRLCKDALVLFKQLFGTDAKVVSIHAGLECGIIINKFPKNKIEAISVGPTVRNPHTVDEYMDLTTCVELFRYVRAIVESLAK